MARRYTRPAMNDISAHITGAILAGGRGSRMGGRDKGLLCFNQRPLVETVLSQLRPQVGRLLIVANRNIAAYRRYGVPVMPDEPPPWRGPLGGLATALDHAGTPWVLTAPCDGPALPGDLAHRLWRAATDAETGIAVAADGERTQPLLALVHTALLAGLRDYLDDGGRAVHKWHALNGMVKVDFSDTPAAFVNLNTPDDLETHASSARHEQTPKGD